MASERQHGMVVFICDGCDDDFESGTDDFLDAVASLKDEGWLITRSGDEEWRHYCPACRHQPEAA